MEEPREEGGDRDVQIGDENALGGERWDERWETGKEVVYRIMYFLMMWVPCIESRYVSIHYGKF